MDKALKEGLRCLAEHEKACAGYARQMEVTLKKMDDMYNRNCEAIKGVKKDRETVERLISNARESCREGRRILGRMGTKESFSCSFVDIVKQAETLTRFQYTRSVYAGTMCTEIAKGFLGALETTLKLMEMSSFLTGPLYGSGGGELNDAHMRDEEGVEAI